jgi:sugar phosphate isomerase/epimerase
MREDDRSVRIGNQTAISAADPMEPFRFARDNGFDAFEWFSDRKGERGFDFDLLSRAERERIREVGRRRNIRYSVHASWQAGVFHESGRAEVQRSIEFAEAVGAEVVVLHLKLHQGMAAFVDGLEPLARMARMANVRIAVENTVSTGPQDFNLLCTLLSRRTECRGVVGMCFDTGHANLHPETRNDYLRFLDRLTSRVPIIHAHLHENHGDHDNHLTLFTGPAGANEKGVRGVLERLEHRGFRGSLILEQWPEPAELLCQARDRLREMMEEMAYEVTAERWSLAERPDGSAER